mgnify:CR=1 FL=1
MDNNDGFDNPDDFVVEIPSEPDHYRNCYPRDGPSYFRQLIEKVRSLQLIPNGPSRIDKEFYGFNAGFENVCLEFGHPQSANGFNSAMRRGFGTRFNAMFSIDLNKNHGVFHTTC